MSLDHETLKIRFIPETDLRFQGLGHSLSSDVTYLLRLAACLGCFPMLSVLFPVLWRAANEIRIDVLRLEERSVPVNLYQLPKHDIIVNR